MVESLAERQRLLARLSKTSARSSPGVDPKLLRDQRRSPLGLGAGGQAAAEGRLVVVENYAEEARNLPAFADSGICAALAAPVREHGEVVGSLVVATHRAGRTYSLAERETLVAFAEHASLALIFDARTRRLAAVEALVRWEHPTRGLLLPGEFIPVAENGRLMAPLGRWVLETACAQAGEWNEVLGSTRPLTVCVNFSSTQFADPEFSRQVTQALEDSGGWRLSGWCSSSPRRRSCAIPTPPPTGWPS